MHAGRGAPPRAPGRAGRHQGRGSGLKVCVLYEMRLKHVPLLLVFGSLYPIVIFINVAGVGSQEAVDGVIPTVLGPTSYTCLVRHPRRCQRCPPACVRLRDLSGPCPFFAALCSGPTFDVELYSRLFGSFRCSFNPVNVVVEVAVRPVGLEQDTQHMPLRGSHFKLTAPFHWPRFAAIEDSGGDYRVKELQPES